MKPFFSGGSSLRRQLLQWLLLPQLVLWIAAAFVTYNVALRYANRAIDASLWQATQSLARQVKPTGNGLYVDLPRAARDIIEADPSDRVYYMVSTPPGQFILGNQRLPAPPPISEPRLGAPYFYDGVMASPEDNSVAPPQRVRVAAMYLAFGDDSPKQTLLVQVARSSANREELAHSILVDTLLPLSGLILLMSLIVWAGIRAGLLPLNHLRTLVEDRGPNDLAPLEIEAAPREVRALARALNTLLAAVHGHVAAHQRFISDAAHQLRTPLAGLKSQTELAIQATTDEAVRARLERVHQSATRSAHLVNQLLTLARAEPGAASAQGRTRVDMRRLARELTAELVPRALQAGVDLGFDDEGTQANMMAEVDGNALLLREALMNLIDNAIRYAGRHSEVTVRVRSSGRDLTVIVEDNGPGIRASDRERVLERFVRATHEGSGAGLGLAIVKEIAEQHGGSVELQDARSGHHPPGLRVELRLPCAKAQI